MMTLQQMANFVCAEMGIYDDYSVFLAKMFVNKEYQMLWEKYPWTDTQTTVTAKVLAGQGHIVMPDAIDRIITVRATNIIEGDLSPATPAYRADSRFLDPVTSTFLVESDPTIFERGGYAKYYEDYSDVTGGLRYLRLYPKPIVDTDLGIIAKAKFVPLVNTDDVPIIRNIDNAVTAYAHFDMLQRQRQYGKADVKRKEAQELETVAWNMEQQQANLPRRTKATTVAGNSLEEMTDAVCTICGVWTPDYRLVIREFLRRNYQSLYDTFLWPESLIVVRMTYIGEQLILPSYLDRVLAVRSPGKMRMAPYDATLLLDMNPEVFGETGEPISYTTLTPVGVAQLPTATTKLVFASTSDVDTGFIAVRGEILGIGQEYEESVQLQGKTPVTSQYAYDVPLTVAKDITVGNITINAENDYLSLGTLRSYLREKKHQRLWLLPTTTTGGVNTVLVMGKRIIVPLITDEDTPIITGMQQVLINAAAADLFRKLEKPDQAAALEQKAQGSVAVLKDKNRDQAASSPRFVPQVEPHSYVAGGTW